jgi:Tol biopolymer transport system component
LILLAGAGSASAAFPGANGKLAFTSDPTGSDLEVYVMNADGSGQTDLTNNDASDLTPTWSPNGQKIAFATDRDLNDEIYVMNADGTSPIDLTNNAATSDSGPAWSNDGQKLAFTRDDGTFNLEIWSMNADGSAQVNLTQNAGLDTGAAWSPAGPKIVFTSTRDGNSEVYVMNADGTGQTNLTHNAATDSGPDWSPDGTKIAFASRRDGNAELYVMNADATNPTRITTNSASDFSPAWSPDGQKIAFRSNRDGNGYEIYVMNADGSGQTRLTNNTWLDTDPDWQPTSAVAGYPRPKGATPLRASLVPAYKQCTAANRTHGAPLSSPSCNPPSLASGQLTVGTPDANGQFANAIGSVTLVAITGDPSTAADEADMRIATSLSDVRKKADLSDYAAEVQVVLELRLTDRLADAQTVQDLTFGVTVPCTATGDTTVGSNCSLTTTADTVMPGAVPESKRSIWGLDSVQVYDGGPDGDADTTGDNTLFETQGVFVP